LWTGGFYLWNGLIYSFFVGNGPFLRKGKKGPFDPVASALRRRARQTARAFACARLPGFALPRLLDNGRLPL
jgi:hypothetical protein